MGRNKGRREGKNEGDVLSPKGLFITALLSQ